MKGKLITFEELQVDYHKEFRDIFGLSCSAVTFMKWLVNTYEVRRKHEVVCKK